MKCRSFLPKINKKSKILILGSMPGVKSLEAQQYYAHPQNRFWKLMGLFCNIEKLQEYSYKERIRVILSNNFALWDVLGYCDREGSLDSNIKNEHPNNINSLLEKYNNIEVICLNGNKAYSTFEKHFPELINKYRCYKMPSTSPANAKCNLEQLYNEWFRILK